MSAPLCGTQRDREIQKANHVPGVGAVGSVARNTKGTKSRLVMPALVAGIHVLKAKPIKGVDGRNKSGHDASLSRRNADPGFRFAQQRMGRASRAAYTSRSLKT
jgi:hypothetical protein